MGLRVHKRPYISDIDNEKTVETFEEGNVFTIEPGVYYPDKNLGIRMEDTIVLRADGSKESLTPMHKELVIPVKG